MKGIRQILIRLTEWCRPGSIQLCFSSPPVISCHQRLALEAVNGQELEEARERILSRLWAQRIDQCRSELKPGPRASNRVIPFPAVLCRSTQSKKR